MNALMTAHRPLCMYHRLMALVEVDAVSKSYPRRTGLRTERQTVVEDVSFEIVAGETLGLVGESGSGKTTVARMILGLVHPAGAACEWTALTWPMPRPPRCAACDARCNPSFRIPMPP